MLKKLLLQALYGVGALGLYHRRRNRDALTVISLHRVLAETDPRWQTCDPLYTLSERMFEQILRFLARHYSIVSLTDIQRAQQGEKKLPPCPLLLTFDDGWADNHTYVLPLLSRLRLPAALFVATDALDRCEAFFQERIIAAWRTGRLNEKTVRELWKRLPARPELPENVLAEGAIRALIAHLQALPKSDRSMALIGAEEALADGQRQMLTREELCALAKSGVEIGTHSQKHEPLTAVPDPATELRNAKAILAHALTLPPEKVVSMSFPFSKMNAAIIQEARDAGYTLLFGGGLTLTPLQGGLPDLLARVPISATDVADSQGNLRKALLGAYLFRRPHRALEAK